MSTLVQGLEMRNTFGNSRDVYRAGQDLISNINDYARLFGGGNNIYQGESGNFSVRLDTQNATPTHVNLQIQVNGAHGNSTIANILIANALGNDLASLANVISGLTNSLNSWRAKTTDEPHGSRAYAWIVNP